GDNNSIFLMLAMLIFSGVGTTVFFRKRRTKE
ncbi:MAG: LPXTG cell wall anchor domain-containing protein, partial [Anaerovoracaceae bacterium]